MKRELENQKSQIPRGSGRSLEKAELDGALDALIRIFEDSHRKLEELLAKVRA
jgi:hypothetical protein